MTYVYRTTLWEARNEYYEIYIYEGRCIFEFFLLHQEKKERNSLSLFIHPIYLFFRPFFIWFLLFTCNVFHFHSFFFPFYLFTYLIGFGKKKKHGRAKKRWFYLSCVTDNLTQIFHFLFINVKVKAFEFHTKDFTAARQFK